MVLVDGRFRVSCALRLLTKEHVLDKDTVVMIHDYYDREHYHVIEQFFDPLPQYDTDVLGVFKMKEDIDTEALAIAVEEYRLDFE